jgi:Leucine-rich repeat (LRR) protein
MNKYTEDISEKSFIDYNIKNDKKKYDVYRNDIKYKIHREIDPKKAVWDKNIKNDFNKDTDNIEYRLEESKNENYESVDLSHMNSNCFEELFNHNIFNDNKHKIQHIFATSSNINNISNKIIELDNLKTLDISNNQLKELPLLPNTIEELIINDNNIKIIKQKLPNLKRLNATNNNILHINFGTKLESIYLTNNPIREIPSLSKLYFLDISNTLVDNLFILNNLKYLYAINTKIKNISNMKKLIELDCSHSYVENISNLPNLENLIIVKSNIKKIDYMNKLECIKFHQNDNIKLSSKYKCKYVKKNKNNVIVMMLK